MEQILSFDQLPAAVDKLNRKLDNIERLLIEQSKQQPITPQEQLLTEVSL